MLVRTRELDDLGSALPALLPGYIERWHLTKTEAGWLVGVFFAAYVPAVPVLLALTDRRRALPLVAVAAIGGYAMLGPLALHLMTLQIFSVMRDTTLASVPFFLFMVGVALPFSIARRRQQGASNGELLRHACTRAAILFALGVFEKNFPFLNTAWDTFRIPGVLQRIAFCYLAATALLLYASRRLQMVVGAVLLIGYWLLLAH